VRVAQASSRVPKFPQQVTVAGGMYAGFYSRGFDPQNVGQGIKEHPLSCPSPPKRSQAATGGEESGSEDLDLCSRAFGRRECVEHGPWQNRPYHPVSEG